MLITDDEKKFINLFNGDCIELMSNVQDESIDLIIADPPYWKVIGEKWDYEWRTLDDYISWTESWLEIATNKLRKGGSLYLFGYFRNLAYMMPLIDKLGLELRQQLIINKGMQSVSGRATKNYKIFPNVTESILLLSKDSKPFIRDFLKSRQKELKLTSKQINERLGVKSNGGGMWSIYTGKNICAQVPTKELWEKLSVILEFNQPKYEEISITFNPIMGITDVWDDINFYDRERFHPTQKPIKLIERLVVASSNPGDLILDPFSGSGTTGVVSKKLRRRFVGIEKDEKYFSKSLKRINNTSL